MKRVSLIAALLFCNSVFAQEPNEKLLFELRFGFIKGGEAVFQTKETRVSK